MNEASSKKPATHVVQIDPILGAKLRNDLIEQGFDLSQPPYTLFSARKQGVSCTLYESGKLVIQGKGMGEFIEFYLEPEILGAFSITYKGLDVDRTPRIGLDEAGKGDFFGPLCLAGVAAEGDGIAELQKMGAQDSKRLSDSKAMDIARKIRSRYAYEVVILKPLKYNELYPKFGNLNRLMAWAYSKILQQLTVKTGIKEAILDKFADDSLVENALKRAKVQVHLTQRTRAEADVVVAAASIVARVAFLEGLERLSQEVNFTLPKGASSAVITAGCRLVRSKGREVLGTVAKTHFKTYQDVLMRM